MSDLQNQPQSQGAAEPTSFEALDAAIDAEPAIDAAPERVTEEPPAPATDPAPAPTPPPQADPTLPDSFNPTAGDVLPQPAPEAAPVVDPNAPPAYVPDYAYEVMGQRHEIAEMYRPLMTSPEAAQTIKEMHEKSTGLQFVKDRLKGKSDELTKKNDDYGVVANRLYSVLNPLQANDIGAWADASGVSREALENWAYQQIDLRANPQGLHEHNERMNAARESVRLKQENDQLRQQQVQNAPNVDRLVADELSKPEFVPHVQAYDAAFGQGSFDRGLRQIAVEQEAQQIPVTPTSAAHAMVRRMQQFQGVTPAPMVPAQPQAGVQQPQIQPVVPQVQQPIGTRQPITPLPVAPQVQLPLVAGAPQPAAIPGVGAGAGSSNAIPQDESLAALQKSWGVGDDFRMS